MRMVDHFKIFDFAGDACLCLWILSIDSCFADTFEGDPLASQHMNSDLNDQRESYVRLGQQ